MKRHIAAAFFVTLLFMSVARSAADDSEAVKLVTTGRIEKIDVKHNTFQFKFNLDQPQRVIVRQNPYPGGRRGGIGGRRGRVGGYPGSSTPNRTSDNSMQVKVFVSESTKLKDPFNSSLGFSALKTGDRVTITAVRRGHGDDLDAQAVSRN